MLISPEPALNDGFGESVALGPSFAVVGAPGYESGDGGLHDYEKAGDAFRLRAVVESPERADTHTEVLGRYGGAVASDGALLFVGAALESEWRDGRARCEGGGVVYVFDRAAAARQLVTSLRGTRPNENFGSSVACAGDLLVVGAAADSSSEALPGAVYVYRRAAADGWSLIGRVEGERAGERFGARVAIDGERFAVSAPGRADLARPQGGGRVDVFDVSEGGCAKVASTREAPGFGDALALRGDRLAIGQPMFSLPGRPRRRWPIRGKFRMTQTRWAFPRSSALA